MLLSVLLMALAMGAQDIELVNPDFDAQLDGWQASLFASAVNIEGRSVGRMAVPDDAKPGYPLISQEYAVQPGDVLELRADIRSRSVRDGYGAYAVIEFHQSGQGRLTYAQSDGKTGDRDWAEVTVRGVAPAEADIARICLIVNGRGEAFFDNVRLSTAGSLRVTPLTGPVTLSVTDTVVCDDLIGFGFEDDGWFYNPENAAKGVSAEDHALREGRIEWMNPDHIRMFVWIKDYCPSGDWAHFTFDSPNMESRCRTLDTYQKLGAEVNITGVEWGLDLPYADPAKAAAGIGRLFEYLIRERGYTCIKYWTLTNEPNGRWTVPGQSFDTFKEVHRKVKEEFVERGLDVKIVGSDDTSGFDWFRSCVKDDDYYATADLFASHRYTQYPDRILAPFFFKERLELLAEKAPRKPFIIEEFGFQDQRSGTVENPIMMTYPYAVWTAAFCIEGLNLGVAGFTIWSIHEMYYPGCFMEYALWEFKDDAWKVRPVYHAMANFTRLTERGDKVR
ncbi:MAG: hypothetical protein RBU21_23375, partial [FCB group bacterium]|nr:hypothetical protein [FCB group bacterium]